MQQAKHCAMLASKQQHYQASCVRGLHGVRAEADMSYSNRATRFTPQWCRKWTRGSWRKWSTPSSRSTLSTGTQRRCRYVVHTWGLWVFIRKSLPLLETLMQWSPKALACGLIMQRMNNFNDFVFIIGGWARFYFWNMTGFFVALCQWLNFGERPSEKTGEPQTF